MELAFKVTAKIQRPVHDVFQAVYDPKKLSAYFTTAGASGPLDEGKTVYWDFADYPGKFPVFVRQVVPDNLITFEWGTTGEESQQPNATPADAPHNTRVEMTFAPIDADSTLVTISESGWRETPKDLKSSYGNCHGWTQMSCCLKAFLEYGINLRKGFY
jgi:uncharacterized protein YndB with AHSA1/START domain